MTMLKPTVSILTYLSLQVMVVAGVRIETDSISGVGVALPFGVDVRTADLINSGQPTLSAVSSSPTFPGAGTDFQASNLNDGDYLSSDAAVTYFDPSRLPAAVTFDLDLTTHTLGYDLTGIGSFMGGSLESRIQCHQIYTVEVSQVGSPAYFQIASVNFSPFSDGAFAGDYESKVILTEDSNGILASSVDSVRFNFSDPGGTPGAYDRGTIIRELDISGFPTGTTTGLVTTKKPVSRQIIQRNSSGLANIPVSGSYTGPVDSIEARAIVMPGPNDSGTSTSWQTVDASPSSGSFSGSLTNVPQGGWYEVEFRSITSGIPSVVSSVSRVGVGDIYLIAGQSNAANFGSPAIDPNDDRVSARTLPTGNSWVRLKDPLPNFDPGSAGTGGSAWTRLGSLLTVAENVPIGFLSLGIGNTKVDDWLSPNLFYLTRIRDSVRSFPPNGFKAILWHQGERDANISTTFTAYQSRLESVIAASRIEPGSTWNVPWYIAEASDQSGSSNLTQEEPIKAAQRTVAFADPHTFLGASTDEFHLENASGGKLSDGIHFNSPGLADHAAQWFSILTGTTTPALENRGFENNTNPAITTKPALAEDSFSITSITDGNSPSVIDWRIMSANGQTAADGNNGYFNPGPANYGANSPANLEGTYAAFLSEGSAGNQFVQSSRYLTKPWHTYSMTMGIGLRSGGSGIFGNARIELLSGNNILGSQTITSSDLAFGEFTDFVLSAATSAANAGEELNVRIVKIDGGPNTYVDFDNVRLTETVPTPFEEWALTFGVSDPEDDPDGDKLPNLLEFALGQDPNNANHSIAPFSNETPALRITRRIANTAGIGYAIEKSTNLQPGSWSQVTGITTTPVGSDDIFETVDLTIDGGWSEPAQVFYRLAVQLIP